MGVWVFGFLALSGYGLLLYSNRALGAVQLSVVPAVWALLTALVLLAKHMVLHNPVVSGYSEKFSMENDIWQLEYEGDDWVSFLALMAPVLGWLLLRQITELGPLRTWQMRHFRNLGFVVWLQLLVTACDTSHRQVYYNSTDLPPIGSPVKP